MFKPLSLFLGFRYTRAKRRNQFISFITLSSFVGIAIGVWALITVLSVMNGFQAEIRDRILGMASHATISSINGKLEDWPSVDKLVEQQAHVEGSAPYILKEGMLTNASNVHGALIRGIEPEEEKMVSEVSKHIYRGSYDALNNKKYGIILGRYLARSIGAVVGSKVTMVTPSANVTPAGIMPRLKRFTVVGIFEVGHNQYDSNMALIHIRDAQILFKMKGLVTGIRLKLDDLYDAPRISRNIEAKIEGYHRVIDWTQHHANLFRAINIEKTMMLIILSLIIAVAAFNIVSTLVIVVNDKQADIAILRTLGASPGMIMRIFISQGMVIGIVGTFLGIITGILTAQNIDTIVPALESFLGMKFLAPDIYLISDLPSEMKWSDVIVTGTISFSLTILATIYPAWRASRVQPAEALRYE
ncbi:MAG: lipoprotein-releasing ABC transporter permease subunit [gamma proteobacterium symbiont of Bathyaustriella thionipta]|nr:lipoprotein-releasing ABC transporter permease subunit [gamma proteobacterium symbiont of Bathyaustriella thionipta]MCU7950464.1 lipoprotein-releasing ABC transporter permease subunit [gamma proteobacterium symbiont of Bathyaustriella thionipta]MCU7953272.1 lipoprotein-releasing ABC transporter permease subunit [gamma proteobacterium symbiont of Bathyaustriella thionipta]MCU7957254.1 lipoprotein-releasing ABC transporter permease subunit [gamma proteobacterium symbiont of Bathyaustriella thio